MLANPGRQILYVEDHADTRELVCMILNKEKFNVTAAATLQEGMRLARDNHFDLYLLDLWLPDGLGLDLARLIRKFDSQTPIVFFSAAAYETDRAEALLAGAQAYLIKPAAPSDLCKLVASLVGFNDLANHALLAKAS